MTRVLLVDDHDFFRGCLADLLNASSDLEAVGECRDGTEVADAVRTLQPDVVVMDVQMAHRNGLDAVTDLDHCGSDTRVIILTSDSRASTRATAVSRGVAGFLIKGIDGERLIDAIRQVARGGTAWTDELGTGLLRPS